MNGPMIIKSVVYGAIATIFMISCETKRFAYAPVTFDMQTPELQGYRSLTFWRKPNIYVETIPSLSSNFIGTWIVSSDTLICIPNLCYSEINGKFTYEVVDAGDTTVISIPQKYIVFKNSIEEITDYSVIYHSEQTETGGRINTSEVRRPKLFRRK